mgnify:FL=1|jgi:S-adenosylmethionine-dependent methyltransferase|tara:strand:+ start:581 stop:1360 length:780 start_codon:yes stop_codon:yes gene_type:complete
MSDYNHGDRNFDDLAEKFARKVYGGLKGEIRLAVVWRDLVASMPQILSGKPLRIIDIGGGLGQLSVKLAALGHKVVYNDLSQNMLASAQKLAEQESVRDDIIWHQCPYQDLLKNRLGTFDLIICHALIEWLAKPQLLLNSLSVLMARNGRMSITFYNHNGLVYRNLIRGNFNVLKGPFSADPRSLTPHNPLKPELIDQWIGQLSIKVEHSSGIRVFHDYVTNLIGGHLDDAAVIDMELKYSMLEPYKWLGRYIHYILRS